MHYQLQVAAVLISIPLALNPGVDENQLPQNTGPLHHLGYHIFASKFSQLHPFIYQTQKMMNSWVGCAVTDQARILTQAYSFIVRCANRYTKR